MDSTIKDVAKLAGVSVGTVSKVINKEGNVKPELQKKVWEAVQRLSYRPNAVARSLKSSSTHTLALILGDLTNPFQMTLAKGVQDVTYEHDYQLLISSTKEDPDIEKKLLSMLYEKRVDGMIICTTGKANEEIRTIMKDKIPVVLVDRPVFSLSVDFVADHNLVGMEMLVDHLFELGHRRIGVVHGDLDSLHGQYRHEGVMKAFANHGITPPSELQFIGNFSFEGGVKAIDHFFELKEPPTAIIASNNNMTAGILRACRDRGIRIPQDLSVVSFGELEYTWNLIAPSVTSVNQSPFTIGRKAAELVLKRLNSGSNEEVSHIFLTPELVIRESSGCIKNV